MTQLHRIPQCDPRAAFLDSRVEIEAAIASVLEGGEYVLGRSVRAFEAAFAEYIGVPYAVGVANGTDAIHLALRAAGIGTGAEVITPSHTAVATVVGIEMAGATPVFVDVDERSYTIDPVQVERAITVRTKALVAVHLYGQPAKLDELGVIARRRGLQMIEDCAQAHGAVYGGRKVGSYGTAGCFSFYPTKNLGAIGDGGIVVTAREEVYRNLCELRQYGWRQRYISQSRGFNSRLDELQAAILLVKLASLDRANARRIELAERYGVRLASTAVCTPQCSPGTNPVYHLYVIRHPERDALRNWLAHNGIGTGIHYPVPVHQQPAYFRASAGPLPVTERVAGEILSLPLYPEMAVDAVDAVAESIGMFDERHHSGQRIMRTAL